MIRLSIGLESLDDIVWDLDQALAHSQPEPIFATNHGDDAKRISRPCAALLVGCRRFVVQDLLLQMLDVANLSALHETAFRITHGRSRRARSCC